ncbi:hypothetical protein IW261DRAFT_1567960 [Armillaria novae-zelandiae]|uniref:Uncharacterized protein n=1 Tax=Armillaria novae-zelandiae TaxID=153914 RepID=A0AA39P111_9AGAR|nr:hypothetical protein IW261DRAFT_1567960 [Armillaria novae-zelandiae]
MPLFDSVVSHPGEWPTEIKDLACLLDSLIPSQLVNGPCPAVSSRASPLLGELRNSGLPEYTTESDTQILDILDLVLSTVGMLRALSDASNDHTKPSTIPFWSLLIRSLAFVCYDKSYITQDAAFVRPRLSYIFNCPRSVVHDEALGHRSMMTAERSNGELRAEPEDQSSSETSYEYTDVSTNPTSAQSSYVPLDAHILASWHHPNSVVLPFICVTDEEDIFSLMGGVLYQRLTWGISEPVIGIILSKTGAFPAIRFAYGDETRIDASLGVYDLTDPVSAVKFSHFILSLRAHVRESWLGAIHRRSNDFRGDQIASMTTIRVPRNNGDKESLIGSMRLQSAAKPGQVTSCSFPMADSENRVTRSSSKLRSARRSMSADSKREPLPADPSPQNFEVAHLKTPSDGATCSVCGTWPARANGGSSNTGKTGKRAKSADALSCSALGAESLAGISPAAELSFSSYAHERHIIGLTNVQFKVNTKELRKSKMPAEQIKELNTVVPEINEMLGFYEKMTQFMKPPLEFELPVVDKRVEDVREHFRSQAKTFSQSKNTPELPQEFWEVISGSFSSLLWASVGGYSKERGGKDHNEAESRHEWDILLNLGFVNAHELASGRVVLERALSLSRNVAADLAKTAVEFSGTSFQPVADLGHNISRLVEQTLNRLQYSSMDNLDILRQVTHVVTLALEHRFDVMQLFKDADEAKRAVLKRSGDEPELGIVDAILTIPLEHNSKSFDPLVRITETRQTVQASRTLNADSIVEPDNDPVFPKGPLTSNGRATKSNTSRVGSARTKSTSTQMAAIEEEYAAAQALSPRGKNKKNAEEWKWMHPFAVTCSVTKLALDMELPSEVVMDIRALTGRLLLAVLIAEYKKPTQTYAKAVVQAKMYLEASVRYLASLGVTKQAVFALATDGVEGAILMAWCSGDSQRVYIVERNVQTFKISQPIQVYHFVTVLLRLREYGDTTLKAAVEAALKAKDFKQSTWSKTAQFDRMKWEQMEVVNILLLLC